MTTRFFPLANELNADCAAGSIDLTTQILSNISSPMSSSELISDPEITTSTGSGTASITLLGPIPEERAQLRSSHVGASGAQTIMYPEDWEGIVTCQVQVGSCHMWGKGLELVESRNNHTGPSLSPISRTGSLAQSRLSLAHSFCPLSATWDTNTRPQCLHESRQRTKEIQRRRHEYRTPWRPRRSGHRPSGRETRDKRAIGDPFRCDGFMVEWLKTGFAYVWVGYRWDGFLWVLV